MKHVVDGLLLKAGFEQKLIDEIITTGRLKKYSTGERVISAHSDNSEMPIVLEGLIKVMSVDEEGNELFLYYLEAGEMCPMSLACCIHGVGASFNVIAEEAAAIWMMPTVNLDNWMAKYHSFRRYVMTSYQVRFEELMMTIDSLVFHDLKSRLLKFLLDTKQATGSYVIHKTHRQIAMELNSSRVVVSRLLKQFEREQLIEQHRNKIEIL